jgi:REP element-mobilizing transposase RayT
MANTYTQLHIHIVFSVKNREAVIGKNWREELEKYMTAIIQKHKHKVLAIYAMRDHVHILIGYNVTQLLPDLIEELKTSTNHWIKSKRFSPFAFAWQRGYGAFAHSKSQVPSVINYILSQEQHHTKKTFREEYLEILEKNDIEYNDEYLFEFFDELYLN